MDPWAGKRGEERRKATHFTILAWRIPWTEELAGYSPWGGKESDTTEQLSLSLLFQTISDEMLPLWMSLSKKFQCTNLLLFIYFSMGSPNGSAVKNPTAMQKPQETQVLSPGRKDPLEESMATHSSILA